MLSLAQTVSITGESKECKVEGDACTITGVCWSRLVGEGWRMSGTEEDEEAVDRESGVMGDNGDTGDTGDSERT